jgi:hypothetical protein
LLTYGKEDLKDAEEKVKVTKEGLMMGRQR